MSLSPLQRDVIARLRLDPTQQAEGYKKARQIQQQAQAEALALKAEEIRLRGALESRFNAAYVRELRSQLAATKEMSAEKRSALQAEMQDYTALAQKVHTLRASILQAQATAKEGQLAASAFRQQGGAPGWEQFGNVRVLGGFTLGGAAQMLGIGALATSLPMALNQIATGFKDAAFSATEFAQELDHISEKTGISSRDLQVLGAIGKTVGLSLDDMVVATRKFSSAMVGDSGDFEGSTSRGAKVLAALGISSRDASGKMRGMNEVMDDVAEKFKAAPNGAEKARIAVELFGRSGLNLIPFLNKGKDGLRELREEFEPYTTDLTRASAAQEQWEKASAKFGLAATKLKTHFAGLVEVLAQTLDGLSAIANSEHLLKNIATSSSIAEFIAKTAVDQPIPQKNAESGAKQASAEFRNAALIAAGAREEQEKSVRSLREEIAAVIRKGQERIADERLKDLFPQLLLLDVKEKSAAGQLRDLQDREKRAAGEELIRNLRNQKELEEEIFRIRAERYELLRKEIKDSQKLADDTNEAVDKAEKELLHAQASSLASGFFSITGGPAAPLGARDVSVFTEQTERLTAKSKSGLVTVQEEMSARRRIVESLQQEIAARLSNQNMSDKDIHALAKLNDLLREQEGLLKNLEKQTPFGHFIDSLKEFGDIVGKFSGGLKGIFSEVFAGIEAIGAAMKQLQVLGGGTQATPGGPVSGGSFFGGIGKIFGGLFKGGSSGFFGSLSGILSLGGIGAGFAGLLSPILGQQAYSSPARGALSGALGAGLGAAGIGGLIGILTSAGAAGAGASGMAMAGIAGAFTGPFAPLVYGLMGLAAVFGLKGGKSSKNAQRLVGQIKDQFKQITKAFNDGTAGLATTITELQNLRAKAVAGTRGGKKGNSQQMQQEIDAIDQQLAQLKRQQKEVLDNFRSQIGIFSLPEGARDVATEIQNIAKALKQAGDAGATASEQIAYLNGALAQLTTKLGRDLRQEEQDTLGLLRQSLDLQKQREQVISDAADAELAVRRRLGLARALTPEQEAALEIKKIRQQRDEQLKQIDEQKQLLDAQLEGRAELFGWNLKDMDVASAKAAILDRQLAIERAITAETIAQVKAQQDLFSQLAAGKIPSLPVGVLPPGFAFPTGAGATYNQTIYLQFPSTPTDPDEFARIVKIGMRRLNETHQYGFE